MPHISRNALSSPLQSIAPRQPQRNGSCLCESKQLPYVHIFRLTVERFAMKLPKCWTNISVMVIWGQPEAEPDDLQLTIVTERLRNAGRGWLCSHLLLRDLFSCILAGKYCNPIGCGAISDYSEDLSNNIDKNRVPGSRSSFLTWFGVIYHHLFPQAKINAMFICVHSSRKQKLSKRTDEKQ